MKHPIVSEIASLLNPTARLALYNDPIQWISEIIESLNEVGTYEIPSRYSRTKKPIPLFYTIEELEEVLDTISRRDYKDEFIELYDELYEK